jgi:hypothetical protein
MVDEITEIVPEESEPSENNTESNDRGWNFLCDSDSDHEYSQEEIPETEINQKINTNPIDTNLEGEKSNNNFGFIDDEWRLDCSYSDTDSESSYHVQKVDI